MKVNSKVNLENIIKSNLMCTEMNKKNIYKHVLFSILAFITDWALIFFLITTIKIYDDYITIPILAIIEYIIISIIYKNDRVIERVLGVAGVIMLFLVSAIFASVFIYGKNATGFIEGDMMILKVQILLLIVILVWYVITWIKRKS